MSKVSRELCLRFAEARRAKGLRQTELAAQVGCTQSALSMFESGQPTKLSEETVKKLSDFLDVPLQEEVSSVGTIPTTGSQEPLNVVHDKAAEESGAVGQGGLVDDHSSAFGLDALHDALNA